MKTVSQDDFEDTGSDSESSVVTPKAQKSKKRTSKDHSHEIGKDNMKKKEKTTKSDQFTISKQIPSEIKIKSLHGTLLELWLSPLIRLSNRSN